MVHMSDTPDIGHVMEYHRWQDFGVCTELYNAASNRVEYQALDNIFYGKTGRPRLEAEAVEWCSECPVKWLCFEYAVVYNEQYGVWGGFPTKQRNRYVALHPEMRKKLLERATEENWVQEELLEGDSWALAIVRQKRQELEASEEIVEESPPSFLAAQTLPESFLNTGT